MQALISQSAAGDGAALVVFIAAVNARTIAILVDSDFSVNRDNRYIAGRLREAISHY